MNFTVARGNNCANLRWFLSLGYLLHLSLLCVSLIECFIESDCVLPIVCGNVCICVSMSPSVLVLVRLCLTVSDYLNIYL